MKKALFKWTGGKQRIVKHYEPYFPKTSIKTYSEPFFGAGTMFLHVVERYDPEVVYLNDINRDVIRIYQAVKDSVGEFCEIMDDYARQYLPLPKPDRKQLYEEVRRTNAWDYDLWTEVEKAAAQYFLLRTAYNGLWKHQSDSNGRFGTNAGSLDHRRSIYDKTVVQYWHQVLNDREVHLMSGDWSKVPVCDFTFYDPPYRLASVDYEHEFKDTELLKVLEIVQENVNVWLANWDCGDDFFDDTSAKIVRFDVNYATKVTTKTIDTEVLIFA